MATRILYPDWRDEQATRNYPFVDSGPPRTFDNRVLPLKTILDAHIHPPNSPGEFYLSSIVLAANQRLTFFVGDGIDAGAASGQFDALSNDPSAVQLVDRAGNSAGVLVVDVASVIWLVNHWPIGEYSFTNDSAAFVLSTWNYTFVNEEVDNITGQQIGVADDLYLVGGSGVRLSCDKQVEPPIIRVHAIGDPLARLGSCDIEPIPRFIREVVFQQGDQTIKCQPNENGEIYIMVASNPDVDSALRLYSTPGELKIGFAAATNK